MRSWTQRTDDVQEGSPDDVIVLELLEKADFPDGRGRDALIFCFQPNLLERHNRIRVNVPGLVDDAVGT